MHLLLLHALPFDGRMWRRERDLLPGHTSAPSLYRLGDTLEDWAEGALAQVPGGDELVVVGCAVGGSCALEVARVAPDRVRALVLVGTKPGVRPDPAFRDAAVRLLAERGLEAAWRTYWRPLFGRDAAADTLAAARALALAQDVDDVIRGVRAFHDRRDRTDVVRAWRKPLVVVGGAEDRTPTPATAAAAATAGVAGGPGAGRRVHRIERCGHYVNLERPAAFRALVAPELDLRPGGGKSSGEVSNRGGVPDVITRYTPIIGQGGPR